MAYCLGPYCNIPIFQYIAAALSNSERSSDYGIITEHSMASHFQLTIHHVDHGKSIIPAASYSVNNHQITDTCTCIRKEGFYSRKKRKQYWALNNLRDLNISGIMEASLFLLFIDFTWFAFISQATIWHLYLCQSTTVVQFTFCWIKLIMSCSSHCWFM